MSNKVKVILLKIVRFVLGFLFFVSLSWIGFIMTFTLGAQSIDVLERLEDVLSYEAVVIIPQIICIIIICIINRRLKKYVPGHTVQGKKGRLFLIPVAIILVIFGVYIGIFLLEKMDNCIEYVQNTSFSTAITKPTRMSDFNNSKGHYSIKCDDFILDNDTPNLYSYHYYMSPFGNPENGQTYWGYILPGDSLSLRKDGLIIDSQYDKEPFKMLNGCKYNIEEIKPQDIASYRTERNTGWALMSEIIKECEVSDCVFVQSLMFNDTDQTVYFIYEDPYASEPIIKKACVAPLSFVCLDAGHVQITDSGYN